jgi:hypothetical protein
MNAYRRAQGMGMGMVAAMTALLLSACTDPSNPLNDCTVAAVRAQEELPAGRWSRLLMATYRNTAVGHTYMVFTSPDGHVFAYDSVFGSRAIYPRSLGAHDVAAAVDPRAQAAWFVEDVPGRGKTRLAASGTQMPDGGKSPGADRPKAVKPLAGPPPAAVAGRRPADAPSVVVAHRELANPTASGSFLVAGQPSLKLPPGYIPFVVAGGQPIHPPPSGRSLLAGDEQPMQPPSGAKASSPAAPPPENLPP